MEQSLGSVAEAQAQMNGLKIKVLILQKQWYAEKNPLQKAVIAANIKGLGGTIKEVNGKYVAKASKLLKSLQTTDPKQKPKTFAFIIQKILEFIG